MEADTHDAGEIHGIGQYYWSGNMWKWRGIWIHVGDRGFWGPSWLFPFMHYELCETMWHIMATLTSCFWTIYHWRHVKIFWDTKVTEDVETMPYFVINFWGKKLTKIYFFKDISSNQKFEKIFFSPMVFWAKKLAETIQYNCSSIVVIIHLKKIQHLNAFLIQENFTKAEIWKYFLMQQMK